ncbi:MAG: hypothetical protein ACK4FJ_18560 [Ferrovibrio sp.]|uniref:hypothetical protein n=1 Tax=Ferrovibrio sp. TaxID=1917215 RepID=UPI003918AE5C
MSKAEDIKIDYRVHDIDAESGMAEVEYTAVGHPDVSTTMMVFISGTSEAEIEASILQMAPVYAFMRKIEMKTNSQLRSLYEALKGRSGRIESCCPECLQKRIAKLRAPSQEEYRETVLPVEVL